MFTRTFSRTGSQVLAKIKFVFHKGSSCDHKISLSVAIGIAQKCHPVQSLDIGVLVFDGIAGILTAELNCRRLLGKGFTESMF